jgi:SNF2 family DNA or RNA helicase
MFLGKLRPFQTEMGLFLVNKKRVINASGTGLGKSVEVIASAEKLFEKGLADRCLIICLATLKEQWCKRIKEFSDHKYVLIDGTPAKRKLQFEEAKKSENKYIVMNYETTWNNLIQVWDLLDLCGREKCVIALDEVTKIKNFRTKTSKRIKTLFARWIWALTATPIENRPDELYSIMEMLNRNVFGSFGKFSGQFIEKNFWGGIAHYKNLDKMAIQVAPYLLRHTREMVKDQLPELIFKDYQCDLGDAQKVYDFVKEDLIADLENLPDRDVSKMFIPSNQGTLDNNSLSVVIQKYTVLRQICQSPQILKTAEGEYAKYLLKQGIVTNQMGDKIYEATELINRILEEEPKNKLVVFNYFKGFLRMLEDGLKKLGHKVLKYTGEEDSQQRTQAQELFNHDPKYRVILCSDAGGYGVDLPAGTHLLNTDIPWHPGKFEQRNRIQRISSKHDVNTILTLTGRRTIEQRMYDALLRKRKMAEAVVDGKHKGDIELNEFVINKETLHKYLTGE